MARIKVAIFDADKNYRERFTDYLMEYKATEMELSVFTNMSFFFETLGVDKFHLFVLGSGYEEVLEKVVEKQVPILILTESVQSYVRESVGMMEGQVAYASKYQSMDGIIRQMQMMTEIKWGCKEEQCNKVVEVIGVCSPIKHEMQMLFSLLYAKNEGRRNKVLYINLLEFSGFSEIFEEAESDIGDVIMRVREGNLKREVLSASIYATEGFSYIAPPVNPESIIEITGEDIRKVLEWTIKETDFEIIILDVGTNVKGFPDIVSICSKMYCLGKKGYLYEVQMRQFLSYLERAVDETYLERIEQVELPGQIKVVCGGISLLEQLDWSEFGDFIRRKM